MNLRKINRPVSEAEFRARIAQNCSSQNLFEAYFSLATLCLLVGKATRLFAIGPKEQCDEDFRTQFHSR